MYNTVSSWTTEYSQQLYNTVNSWTTEYSQQMYTAEQLNTVNNCTQLDNWIQWTNVHNRLTEYSQ